MRVEGYIESCGLNHDENGMKNYIAHVKEHNTLSTEVANIELCLN